MSKNAKLSDAAATETPPAAETKPEDKPADAPALSADRAECKRFVDAFGAVGGQWFAEGLSFEQAQVRFTKELREENEKLKGQNGELNKKLAAAGAAGELTPVGFDAADKKKERTGFASKIRIAAATVTGKK
jgi:hypothetical protein